MLVTPITRDCASCVVDNAMDCRKCLAEDLLRAQAQGDADEAVQLQYLILLVEGVVTAVTMTAPAH
jgi:hypothetical protein